LRDAKRGHERACIPERRGGVVDLLRCGSHDDLLSRPSRDVAERGRSQGDRSILKVLPSL
jgi:hypothetical protein